MLFTKKGFTLVEMMVAILLSAIVIFFSYTLTISAYKMFSKVSSTSQKSNSIKFFEEALKKSITEAETVKFESNKITCTRYDMNLNHKVKDTYTLEEGNCNFGNLVGKEYDVFPNIIPADKIFKSTKLFVKTEFVGGGSWSSPKILVLNNVRAFYYRPNKYPSTGSHLDNVTIGIIYDDYVVPNLPKRQYRSFCLSSRNGSIS
jgi:prepilin-type N-terminal cleavage/methylation domain-containing protein